MLVLDMKTCLVHHTLSLDSKMELEYEHHHALSLLWNKKMLLRH